MSHFAGLPHTHLVSFSPLPPTYYASGQREETLSRRNEVNEPWLASVIQMINAQVRGCDDNPGAGRQLIGVFRFLLSFQLWAPLSAVEQQARRVQYEAERLMLLQGDGPARPLAEQEQQGRQTGDEQWRRQRGELGSGASAAPSSTAVLSSNIVPLLAPTTAAQVEADSTTIADSAASTAEAMPLPIATTEPPSAAACEVASTSTTVPPPAAPTQPAPPAPDAAVSPSGFSVDNPFLALLKPA